MLNTQQVKEYAYTLGFDTVHITTAEEFGEARKIIKERIALGLMDGLSWFTAERADVSCRPNALLPDATSIIALGMVYLTEPPGDQYTNERPSQPQGRISRYAWGDDYHEVIKPKLRQFATWLQEQAHANEDQGVETRLFVDTGRMVDRAVAQRAGLGWYGKNTNILTKKWGSWIFLASIVTNLHLEPDEPIKTNCGSCEICLHACPTGALPQPYVLDNTRCISFLTIELRDSIPLELRPLMGNLIFGCDICQEVCPVNKVAAKRQGRQQIPGPQLIATDTIQRRESLRSKTTTNTVRRFTPHHEFYPRPTVGGTPELIPLLSLTEEEFRERFRRSPIKRAKRRGLLRNVCVALGNSGDTRAIPALIETLNHEHEPLVRGHAAWALGRLGGTQAEAALQQALTVEQDQEVQMEIRNALTSLERRT